MVASNNSEFSVTPSGTILSPSASEAFVITFGPTSVGTKSGEIVFTHDAASSPDTVSVTGTGVEPTFAVSPESLAFGNVVVGLSKQDSVTVTNSGTATLIISSVASSNGEFSITPGSASIPPSGSGKFYVTFSPADPGPEGGSIVFIHSAASSPETVAVTGTGTTYTITASASAGGSISPSGSVPVNHGSNQSFTIAPDTGYHIDSVVVDGVNQGVITTYDFLNVTANHTIAAYFSINVYTITAGVVGNGSITPQGVIPVTYGSNQGFTISPDFYHHIDSVVVDGVDVGPLAHYTFSGVTANHTITAYFSIDSILFLTVSPESLFNEDPGRPGKPKRPARRGKGIYPNWSNLFDETVLQGGFAPGTSESDSAGGAVIGISHMYRKSPSVNFPRWTPIKDSAAVRAWVRVSRWNFRRGMGTGFIGKGFKEFQRTLRDRTGWHTGVPRGLDSLTDGSGTRLRKQWKRLYPRKHNNRLFPELVALKMNIAMSQLGKTPPGFGDLLLDAPGNPFDGVSIKGISARADSMMTYWEGHTQAAYDSLYAVVAAVNRAFIGKLDTLSFETPTPFFPRGTLTVKGQVPIGDVGFLKLPMPFVPTRIIPQNGEVESEDEPDDDPDFDDDADDEEEMPFATRLYQNFPNPFNPMTSIAFRLREDARVSLKVYSMLGQEVASLLTNEELEEGLQIVQFNASGLSSGVYFYRIQAEGLDEKGFKTVETGKMVLMK